MAAVSASGWQPVHSDGDITVTVQSLRGRALWRVVANVPTPPSAAAAGMRQLWRTWGHGDSVVPSVIVLQEGGAVPSTVTDCACCFEQLLQALCVGPPEVGGVDFLLRSVWTIYQGQHTAAIRSTAEVRAAQVPGSRHEEISADVWIAPNPVVPGTSVVRVVVLPPASVSAATLAGNGQAAAHRVVVWMRRLQEAALMIQSQPVIS